MKGPKIPQTKVPGFVGFIYAVDVPIIFILQGD